MEADSAYQARMDVVANTIRGAKGNVSQEVKDLIAKWWVANAQGQGFGRSICERLVITDMQLFDNPEVPGKKEARMLFEIEVQKGVSEQPLLGMRVVDTPCTQICATI